MKQRGRAPMEVTFVFDERSGRDEGEILTIVRALLPRLQDM